jgi:hypothetical protein
MFKNIGNKLNSIFLFGIGGIGDFLLLMSDGNYDKYDNLGLIFWANNPEQITEISKLFTKLTNKIITKNYLESPLALEYYKQIINDSNFLSSAHIPRELKYVEEWMTVSDVFTKYNIQRFPEWANDWKTGQEENIIICPTGGSSDTAWKFKNIDKNLLKNIIADIKLHELWNDNIIILSTANEMNTIYGNEFIKELEYMGCIMRLDIPYKDIFKIIGNAWRVYSVDSWFKTFSLLSGIDTILIKSKYIISPIEIFGLDKDPADNIFISKKWNFLEIIEQ